MAEVLKTFNVGYDDYHFIDVDIEIIREDNDDVKLLLTVIPEDEYAGYKIQGIGIYSDNPIYIFERYNGSMSIDYNVITQKLVAEYTFSKDDIGKELSIHHQNQSGFQTDKIEAYIRYNSDRRYTFITPQFNGAIVSADWFNQNPTTSLNTTDNRTLYENDTYNISGTAQDSDAGDVVTVRYSLNNGQERAIDTRISDGVDYSFNHTLTFQQGRLYRNGTAVTDELAEGSEHVLRVWVEDDNGGQSEVVQRSFYVVPNRMPELTVEPFGSRTDLIDSDKVTFRGEANDPDGNDVTVSYKINNGSYQEVYNGAGGAFEFQVAIGALSDGDNNVTVRSQDSYGAEVQKVLRVSKAGSSVPLKTSVARYKIEPPNGTAKGVVLWLQRETGDLVVNARIHMGANGDPENFQDMTRTSTAFVDDGMEEDEFTFENATEAENIVLEVTMQRNSTSSDEGIKMISGVLS